MTRIATKTFVADFSTGHYYHLVNRNDRWGSADVHLPIGVDDSGDLWYEPYIHFPIDFNGMAVIRRATLYLRVTAGIHFTRVGTPTFDFNTVTSGYVPNYPVRATVCGGGGWTQDNYSPPMAKRSTQQAQGNAQGSTQTFDLMANVYDWAPGGVYVNGYGYGGSVPNIALCVAPFSSYHGRSEFWSERDTGGRQPYLEIEYELPNEAPYAPGIASPANGSRLAQGDVTVLVNNPGDPDNDAIYACQVNYSGAANGSVAAWWNGSHWQATIPSPTPGQTLYINAQAMDEHNAWSGAGGTISAYINTSPSNPVISTGMQPIHNLGALAEWTGSEAKPIVRMGLSDPDGDAITRIEMQIRDTSGGPAVHTDNREGSWPSGSTVDFSIDYGIGNDVVRYVAARCRDAYGAWSGWEETPIKVRWSQAIYEHQAGAGAGQFTFEPGVVSGSSPTVAFAFRSADGPASGSPTVGPWVSSIDQIGDEGYVNVLVRLSIGRDSSVPTALADMRIGYLGAAQQPDSWAYEGEDQAAWALSEGVRRYGTKSLGWVRATSVMATYAEAITDLSGNHYVVPVQRDTEYTLSVWVRASMLHGEAYGFVRLLGGVPLAATDVVSETLDEWVRLSTTFMTDSSTQMVAIGVRYDPTGDGVGDRLWVDAVQLEEGSVASAWNPGQTGAVVVDVGGISIDASKGASFRLRGSDGGLRDTVELGASGLIFGGDAEISSPSSALIAVPAFQADFLAMKGHIWADPDASLDIGDSTHRFRKLYTADGIGHPYSEVVLNADIGGWGPGSDAVPFNQVLRNENGAPAFDVNNRWQYIHKTGHWLIVQSLACVVDGVNVQGDFLSSLWVWTPNVWNLAAQGGASYANRAQWIGPAHVGAAATLMLNEGDLVQVRLQTVNASFRLYGWRSIFCAMYLGWR